MSDALARSTRPISVVVPTRDRAHLLEPCLKSLRVALRPPDQLIVVDSASTSPDVRDVALSFGATYIRCDLPGTSRARNAGWRAAVNDIVAFVDDDVRVDPNWAQAIGDAFNDPGVAFVTGRIGWPPTRMASGPVVAILERDEPIRLDSNADPAIVGHSANLAVRRQALEHIGGFDELLGPGVRFRAAEDHDLFDRLFSAGYIGRFEPAASSHHEAWRRIREFVRLQGSYGFGTGARIAKLIKTDRQHGVHAARVAVFDWGIRPLWRAIRLRRRTEVIAQSYRLAMTLAGFATAIFYPVRDGHLLGRRPSV